MYFTTASDLFNVYKKQGLHTLKEIDDANYTVNKDFALYHIGKKGGIFVHDRECGL